jgi:hypothetical protein
MNPKNAKGGFLLIWACVGLAYFNTFSSLDLPPMLQMGLALVPAQIGLIAYLLWFRHKPELLDKGKGSALDRDQ